MLTALMIIGGGVLLVIGADLLVRGAAKLALAVGISPLVIGLTVVAYGTSAPELAVSLSAGAAGSTDISVGNIVGSNLFNILFVLGASALAAPLVISRQVVRLDVPIMIGVSLVTWWAASNGMVSRVEGVLLVIGSVCYSVFQVFKGRREAKAGVEMPEVDEIGKAPRKGGIPLAILSVIVGLAMLVFGSDWLVEGSCKVARALGVSELVIGLTLVAGGTSLPEAATSIVASIRGQRDMAVGNIIGSSIFNLLLVLGTAAAVNPDGVSVSEPALQLDIPFMVAATVACLPIFFTGAKISRAEGALFLAYYVAYIIYLILAASHHEGLADYTTLMFTFVAPVTALGLVFSVAHSIRERTRRGEDSSGA